MEIIKNYDEYVQPSNITATSVDSITIGTGDKALTVQPNKAFLVGMSVKISNSLNTWLFGTVKSYNIVTGALVVAVVSTSGIGTYQSWQVYISTPFSGEIQQSTIRMNFFGTDLIPTTGAAIYVPHRNITVTNALLAVGVTSSVPTIVDLKKNNTSIMNSNYLVLPANTAFTQAIGLNFNLTTTDALTADIISAGGGKNLTITLVYS